MIKQQLKFKEVDVELNPEEVMRHINQSIAEIIPVDKTGETIKSMAHNIQERGQINPILIYRGQLVDGRHRCLACMMIGRNVRANIIDDNVSIEEIENYITSIEMQTKSLTNWQRALITYERYVLGRGYSIQKASGEANIRREKCINHKRDSRT
jgi:ParB-like chromosome segregation protein Spo0J